MSNTLLLSEWGPAHLRPETDHSADFDERPDDN